MTFVRALIGAIFALTACSTTTVGGGQFSDGGSAGDQASSGGAPAGGGGQPAVRGGAGGSTATGGGTAGAAAAAGAGGGPPAITIDGVHGRAFDLGGGRVRITYDFSTSDQAQDFSPATGATVDVVFGQLQVANVQGMAIGLFVRRLHTDRVSFDVTLLDGSTTMWFVNTVWDGFWNPAAGYGAFHDQTGRVLLVNGTQYPTSDVAPIVMGRQYHAVVDQTDTLLSWTLDGVVASQQVYPLPATDRSIGLGGWDSTVALDDVVIEGTLDAP